MENILVRFLPVRVLTSISVSCQTPSAETDCSETSWRKQPTHQGGFLLDGGIHRIAALRLLLGPENAIARLSAFTNQVQEHLPPVDSIDATMRTKSGATGTVSMSYGTTFKGSEWALAYEKGTVAITMSTVTTVFDGKEERVGVPDERMGEPPEIRKWGQAIASGVRNERHSPEQALADLELMELMLRSGEKGGMPMDCGLQT